MLRIKKDRIVRERIVRIVRIKKVSSVSPTECPSKAAPANLMDHGLCHYKAPAVHVRDIRRPIHFKSGMGTSATVAAKLP
jgi:hypothetical protein